MGDMTGLLLLLWVGVTVSTAVYLQKRIIGGVDCQKTERQYHVKLIYKNGAVTDFCGGSLISERWILTAAHCRGGSLTAYLGMNLRGQTLQMFEIKEKPKIFKSQRKEHDIMLLKLPSTFLNYLHASKITPVQLPDCTKPPPIGTPVQIAGYGSKSKGQNNERQSGESGTLQCADINIVDCQGLINTLKRDGPDFYRDNKHEHWGCYQTPGVDACYGDSGGGVIYNSMIYGVHSIVGSRTHACIEPSAFMDICNPEYNKWIRDTISPKEKKKSKNLCCGR